MANGVPQQVARVYVHNTPDGLCYRFLSVRLGSLSAASTSTVAVTLQRIKGFTQRAEKDMESLADNRIGCQDNVRLKQVSKCQVLPSVSP